jgi:hypothetical protein
MKSQPARGLVPWGSWMCACRVPDPTRRHEVCRNVAPDNVWYGRRDTLPNWRRGLAIRAAVPRRQYQRRTVSSSEATGTGAFEVLPTWPPICVSDAQNPRRLLNEEAWDAVLH